MFYKLGYQSALKKYAAAPLAARALMPGVSTLAGAGKGAIFGSGAGALVGAMSAPEGQKMDSALQGLTRGALLGGGVGGLSGLLRGLKINKMLGDRRLQRILRHPKTIHPSVYEEIGAGNRALPSLLGSAAALPTE